MIFSLFSGNDSTAWVIQEQKSW